MPEILPMHNETDWDYGDLLQRMLRLRAPPFHSGASPSGEHCPHCPQPDDANCALTCRVEYQKIYGVAPEE